MSSRKLAEQIDKLWIMPYNLGAEKYVDAITALIDAWVRVREAEVRLDAMVWCTGATLNSADNAVIQKAIHKEESALATARKQLEEKS